MIVVAGHLSIDPDQRDAALAAIGPVMAATRAEPGNTDYRFSIDAEDPSRINLLEIWESEEAIDAHMSTPHLAAFMEAIGPCVAGAPSITRYDVSGSSTLF